MTDTKSVSTKGNDKVSVNIFGNIVNFVSDNKVITISIIGLVVVCVYLYQRSRKNDEVDEKQFPLNSYQHPIQEEQVLLEPEPESESDEELVYNKIEEVVYNNVEEKEMKNDTPHQRSESPPPPPRQMIKQTRIPDDISDNNSRIIDIKDLADADEYALNDQDNMLISELKNDLADSEEESAQELEHFVQEPIVQEPIVQELSEVEYYKIGPKKGQPKPKKVHRKKRSKK